ncbi:MAG: aldo/keto reductase [Bacteroidota bacterium]|nr:aldo/keto reductase [Bacteroidota bacterium]
MSYTANDSRYQSIPYKRSGKSGLLLPKISLGLWHNFGSVDDFSNSRQVLLYAFDKGITHFDLANNYGPIFGSAEETLGKVLKQDLYPYRDELIISTKAGYLMWDGPYGEWGSRKYLISSLDQSLKRMGLEYVDIFYSHRPDPETPLDETMGALSHIVKQGKALYVGISNYSVEQTKKASEILRNSGTPCLIHQPRYSMLDRWIEGGLLELLEEEGIGCIAFSPLAQGLLSDKYLNGIPKSSRAANPHGFLQSSRITPELVEKLKLLNHLAGKRQQSLAQMALAWVLKEPGVTSVLVGAKTIEQLEDSLGCLKHKEFSEEELTRIDKLLKGI